MKKHLIILFSFLLFGLNLSAQNVQGIVVDEFTGKGIAFVSIGIIGTNSSTVTNENGEFVLKIATYPALVKFSHISYSLGETTIYKELDQKLLVKLKPAINSLKEVVIDANKAENLLRLAFKKAKDNANNQFFAHTFYRQLSSINNTPTQIYEMFYDIKWNTKAIKGWIVKQTRFAEDTSVGSFDVNNQSFLTLTFGGTLLPEQTGNFISARTIKDYEIFIEKYIEQEDQDIVVINCWFKNARKNIFYVNSTYYIGSKDFKVYRLENNIFNIPINFPVLLLKLPPFLKTIATFNGNGHNYPVLESISTNLSLSFIKDNSESNMNISSLLTVFQIDESLKKQNFQSLDSRTQDHKTVRSVKYDAEFWKNNPIVKQTALEDSFIKMMESKSAFGTMTNP